MGFFSRKPEGEPIAHIRKLKTLSDVESELKLHAHKVMTRAEADVLLRRCGAALADAETPLITTVTEVTIDGELHYFTLYDFNGRATLSDTHEFPHHPHAPGHHS